YGYTARLATEASSITRTVANPRVFMSFLRFVHVGCLPGEPDGLGAEVRPATSRQAPACLVTDPLGGDAVTVRAPRYPALTDGRGAFGDATGVPAIDANELHRGPPDDVTLVRRRRGA